MTSSNAGPSSFSETGTPASCLGRHGTSVPTPDADVSGPKRREVSSPGTTAMGAQFQVNQDRHAKQLGNCLPEDSELAGPRPEATASVNANANIGEVCVFPCRTPCAKTPAPHWSGTDLQARY